MANRLLYGIARVKDISKLVEEKTEGKQAFKEFLQERNKDHHLLVAHVTLINGANFLFP